MKGSPLTLPKPFKGKTHHQSSFPFWRKQESSFLGKWRLISLNRFMQIDILDEDVSRKVKRMPQTEFGFKGQIGTPDPFVFISILLFPQYTCRNQIQYEQSSLTIAPWLVRGPGSRVKKESHDLLYCPLAISHHFTPVGKVKAGSVTWAVFFINWDNVIIHQTLASEARTDLLIMIHYDQVDFWQLIFTWQYV